MSADVVVVLIGARKLALPRARVREIVAVSTVTPVPTAPSPVVGLTQLRGQVVPILDLAGGALRAARPNDLLVVIELGPTRAALLVDRVLSAAEAADPEPLDVGALFDELRSTVQAAAHAEAKADP